jgi:tetratricopeptide (TPR) repeat protein
MLSNSSMRAIRTIMASLPGVLLSAVLLMGWPRARAHAQNAQSSRKADGTAKEIKRKFDAALSAYRSRQYAKAEPEIASLLAAAPDSFEVNELAGLIYVGEGEYGKADSYLAKAVCVKGDVVEARTALAANLLRLQKTREAEKQFREAQALDPASYDTNHNLGEFYIQVGDIASAIPFLKQAQELEPAAYNNSYDLALAYERSGGLDEARSQLQKLIASDDAAELHSLLGEVEERAGNYVASASQYEQAARMEPNEENILDWGSEFLLHQTFEPAVEVFKAGLARLPHSAKLLDGLGIALYGLDRYDDAARAFFQASDLNPSDHLPLTFLGRVYENLSPPVAAEVRSRLQRFLEVNKRDAAARYYYAMCLWKLNEQEPQPELTGQIESLLQQALELDPGYSDAHVQLGTLYFRRQNYSAASNQYELALRSTPNEASIHYHLAQALARTGDKARAGKELREFARLRQAEQDQSNKQHSEIKLFVYTMRNANNGGNSK